MQFTTYHLVDLLLEFGAHLDRANKEELTDVSRLVDGRESPGEQEAACGPEKFLRCGHGLRVQLAVGLGRSTRLAPREERTKVVVLERQSYPLSSSPLFKRNLFYYPQFTHFFLLRNYCSS